MYISELSVHGFKSFGRKTRLQFSDGITAVVGPNGCGKTNLVDAVRWVLGEQKYRMLRGSRIDDIIFGGSDTKRPVNVCEVSLTVHNDKGKLPVEYTDVEVTRRAFRDGASEYMINRTPCRLKDIQDLFVDTGMGSDAYSVIELKMVEDILSENTDDRRRMFEEAAGINKYKQQRKSTLRQIDAVRADLERVNDIVAEVEAQVHSLQLQLKSFDRHATLRERLQKREIELAWVRKQSIGRNLEPLRRATEGIEQRLQASEEEDSNQENILDGLKKSHGEQQAGLNTLREKLDELSREREEKSSTILVLKEKAKSAERTIERLLVESEENSQKIRSLEFNIKQLEIEKEAVEPKIKARRDEYQDRKEEFDLLDNLLKEAEEKLDHLNDRQMEHLKDLNAAVSLLQRTIETVEEKKALLNRLEAQYEKLEEEEKKLQKAKKEQEKKREDIEKVLTTNRKQLAALDTKIGNLRSQKHDVTLEFHRIASQVESLESRLQFYREIIDTGEGLPSGVRHVLMHSGDYPEVRGTVADLIDVDSEYSLAVSAALGPLAHSLVCKTREGALKIIEDLAKENKGGVTLVPLDTLNVGELKQPELPEIEGILGYALDLVGTDPDVEPLIHLLLRDVVFVKDSSVAEKVWKTKEFSGCVADLDGRYYDRSGMISDSGGHEQLSLLGRKEKINKLDQEIDRCVKKGNATQEKIRTVDRDLVDLEGRHHHLSKELARHIDSLAEIEKQITRNEYSISQNVESLQATMHQIVSTRDEILKLERNLDQYLPRIRELEEQQANYEEKIKLAKQQLDDAKKKSEEARNTIQEIRFDLINLENEHENLGYKIKASRDAISDLESRKTELSDEIERLKAEMEQLKIDSIGAEDSLKKITAQYRKEVALRDLKEQSFQGTRDQIDQLQTEMRNRQKLRENMVSDLKRMELQAADLEGQIDLIKGRIQDRYHKAIPELRHIGVPEDELLLEIERIERSIERIGPINMAVKEEFEQENSRLEFLVKQRNDLVDSEGTLLESMRKIDSAARRQFLDAFDQIRMNYARTFKLFFEGGSGDLQLAGEDDPLEADIVIFAKPPGKRTRSLRALSSGEKALTAIALLFAIYQVKPSPFCILDEVDAPLDDINVGRFTTILKEFAQETQFMIVTHNKLTMESAAQLYGVTMEQSGISKIVSVRFD